MMKTQSLGLQKGDSENQLMNGSFWVFNTYTQQLEYWYTWIKSSHYVIAHNLYFDDIFLWLEQEN